MRLIKQTITKTDFLVYLDAPRHLWAIKHGKVTKQKIHTFLEHLFKQGSEVEKLGENYIRSHLIPKYGASEKDILLQPPQIEKTEVACYEARTDVLIKNPGTGKWDMYEIKSSTKIDKTHKYDVTFQALVYEKHYDLGDIYILHLNGEYIKQGELSLGELFVAENVNEYVEELRDEVIQKRYDAYLTAKAGNLEAVPECIRPKTCPCLELCHPNLPEYSIYDINRITGNEKKVRELVGDGILDVMDVPKGFPLSDKQRFQVDVAKSGKTIILKDKIGEHLGKLVYPLFFLDYESFNPAIPMYDGYKPYDQMPFQYSLHIKRTPDSELEHYEFVEARPVDPIPNMLNSLQKVICTEGSIIVWNQAFEATLNTRMGEIHPRFAKFTENMNSRIFDLMKIFQDQLYADPRFKGSYSIKKVLPILVPDLSYDGMDIAEGADAMASWNEMVYGKANNKEKVKQDLLKYCKLDTLAMVRIWEVLMQLFN